MGVLKKRKIDHSFAISAARKLRSLNENPTGRLSPHQYRTQVAKRVRFTSNMSNSVKTSVRYLGIFRSELDKPNMWYSHRERAETIVECEGAVEDFKIEHAGEISNYENIFDYCIQPPSQETSNFLESAQLNIPASIRGIEWGWVSRIKRYRRDHVQGVISVQEQVKGLKPAMKDRVLSSRSLKSSRAGRIMARLVGESDARNETSECL